MPLFGTDSKSKTSSKSSGGNGSSNGGDVLDQSQLSDPLSQAKIGKKTRLHTSSKSDSNGKAIVNTGKSNGDRVGNNISRNSNVKIDFTDVDSSGSWVKGQHGQNNGYLKLNKVKGQSPDDAYNVGDKFYGLKKPGGNSNGYHNQIDEDHSKYDSSNKPTNEDFINTLSNAFGVNELEQGSGKDAAMAKALKNNEKFSPYIDMPGALIGSQAALQGNLETMEEDNKIRFILDGIKSEDVVPGGKFDDKCTATELRFIYRNWGSFKNKVSFYRKDQEVPAPWLTEPAIWKGAEKLVHDDL